LSLNFEPVKIKSALIPVDLSEYSLKILDYAHVLKSIGVEKAYLLHVIEHSAIEHLASFDLESLIETLKSEASKALEKVKEGFSRRGLEAEVLEVEVGHPAREVANKSIENNASIIAMMSRGKGFLRVKLFGSVAEEVLNMCAKPTLIFKERGESARREIKAILAPLALDDIDDKILSYSLTLAQSLGSEILIAHIMKKGEKGREATERLGAIAERLREHGVKTDFITSVGEVCREILEIAEHTNADMIVLGDNECAERPEARLRGRSVIDCVVRRFRRHAFVVF